MNPVSTEDLEDRWRPLTDAETIIALSLLNDAWAIINTLEPSVDSRVTAGTLSLATVIQVETAMVLRVLRNPDAKFQESVDDYSYTRDKAVSGGLLYLSADERMLLRVRTSGSAFSIVPGL